jgi:2-oxoglutarate dehydrogenase complex dehydrogenase (E1) component-like enzyme
VLDDPAVAPSEPHPGSAPAPSLIIDPDGVQRVLLCSGKVAFDAMARRDQLAAQAPGLPDPGVAPGAVAIVRVEQLYPWPEEALGAVLDRYPEARQVIWLQEEPENMGAWSFAHGRLHRLLRERFTLTHVSRSESASPATGSAALHHLEHEDLLARGFA